MPFQANSNTSIPCRGVSVGFKSGPLSRVFVSCLCHLNIGGLHLHTFRSSTELQSSCQRHALANMLPMGTTHTTLALVPCSSRWQRECNQNVTFCLLLVLFFFLVFLFIASFVRRAIRKTTNRRRAAWTQTGLLFQSVDKWWEQIHVRVKGPEHSVGTPDNHSTLA